MDTFLRFEQHLPPFVVSILHLTIWLAALMIIFIPLEWLFAVRAQKISRKGFLTDLGYYFLNNLLPGVVLIFPLSLVAWAAHHYVPYRLHSAVADLPFWARLTGALIVGEVGFYWGHRWSHQIPFLWRFHAIHHSAEHIDWLVNTHAHPFDMIFTRLCGFIPLYVLGFIQPSSGNANLTPVVVVLLGAVWGFFIHANLRWRFGWLEWVIATPAFHHWHHTKEDHTNKNYASTLPWLDKIFGTFYMPKNQWPARYGIDAATPDGLPEQLMHPFLPVKHPAGAGMRTTLQVD